MVIELDDVFGRDAEFRSSPIIGVVGIRDYGVQSVVAALQLDDDEHASGARRFSGGSVLLPEARSPPSECQTSATHSPDALNELSSRLHGTVPVQASWASAAPRIAASMAARSLEFSAGSCDDTAL